METIRRIFSYLKNYYDENGLIKPIKTFIKNFRIIGLFCLIASIHLYWKGIPLTVKDYEYWRGLAGDFQPDFISCLIGIAFALWMLTMCSVILWLYYTDGCKFTRLAHSYFEEFFEHANKRYWHFGIRRVKKNTFMNSRAKDTFDKLSSNPDINFTVDEMYLESISSTHEE